MKGHGCHPAGARSVRPLRSDRRKGRCRLVGREKVNWAAGPREAGLGHDSARHPCVIALSGKHASARFFASTLFRSEWQISSHSAVRSLLCHPEERSDEGSRACAQPTDAICTVPWNDPSVTACGRASSPQRGAEWGGCSPSLWRALLRAPCTSDGQNAPSEVAFRRKTGCARFPRVCARAVQAPVPAASP